MNTKEEGGGGPAKLWRETASALTRLRARRRDGQPPEDQSFVLGWFLRTIAQDQVRKFARRVVEPDGFVRTGEPKREQRLWEDLSPEPQRCLVETIEAVLTISPEEVDRYDYLLRCSLEVVADLVRRYAFETRRNGARLDPGPDADRHEELVMDRHADTGELRSALALWARRLRRSRLVRTRGGRGGPYRTATRAASVERLNVELQEMFAARPVAKDTDVAGSLTCSIVIAGMRQRPPVGRSSGSLSGVTGRPVAAR